MMRTMDEGLKAVAAMPAEYTVEQREADQKLVNWSDLCESDHGVQTSMYYRLQPQVIEARARLKKNQVIS